MRLYSHLFPSKIWINFMTILELDYPMIWPVKKVSKADAGD